MGRGLVFLQRAGILAAVWVLALIAMYNVAVSAVEYHGISRDVKQLQADRQLRLERYSQLLAEGQRISGDERYQIGLLKRRFGYTEPDETPIIVLTQP